MKTPIFVSLIQCANPNILDYIVMNNQSIVTYALNKVPLLLIKFYIKAAGGGSEINNINEHSIRKFLKANRPDLLRIVEKNPGWLEREIVSAKNILQKI